MQRSSKISSSISLLVITKWSGLAFRNHECLLSPIDSGEYIGGLTTHRDNRAPPRTLWNRPKPHDLVRRRNRDSAHGGTQHPGIQTKYTQLASPNYASGRSLFQVHINLRLAPSPPLQHILLVVRRHHDLAQVGERTTLEKVAQVVRRRAEARKPREHVRGRTVDGRADGEAEGEVEREQRGVPREEKREVRDRDGGFADGERLERGEHPSSDRWGPLAHHREMQQGVVVEVFSDQKEDFTGFAVNPAAPLFWPQVPQKIEKCMGMMMWLDAGFMSKPAVNSDFSAWKSWTIFYYRFCGPPTAIDSADKIASKFGSQQDYRPALAPSPTFGLPLLQSNIEPSWPVGARSYWIPSAYSNMMSPQSILHSQFIPRSVNSRRAPSPILNIFHGVILDFDVNCQDTELENLFPALPQRQPHLRCAQIVPLYTED
ncbi:hypothetical protein B0H10DRAFT_1958692 [Mycena sp. CBHHK59/15]|nr:hypothetical protein B0H10DRAFT_1958692 [Mycena sp. CBHHK59/15]